MILRRIQKALLYSIIAVLSVTAGLGIGYLLHEETQFNLTAQASTTDTRGHYIELVQEAEPESSTVKAAFEPLRLAEKISPVEMEAIEGDPVRIEIPSVNIKLPVHQGDYHVATAEWTLWDAAAFWGSLTPKPSNQPGNTMIYAHNRVNAFKPLKDIKPGALVYLYMKDGSKFTYKYHRDEKVGVEQFVLRTQSDKPEIMLLTCNGTFNETRRLLYAELIDIEMP